MPNIQTDNNNAASLIKLLGSNGLDSRSLKYSISNFLGMFPRYQSYLIKDSASQLAIDANTLSGGLEAFRQDALVIKTPELYEDFYRYVYNDKIRWLYFTSPVEIARSAVIEDVNNQTFITGIGDGLRIFDANTLNIEFGTDNLSTIDSTNSYYASIERPARPTMAASNEFTTTRLIEQAAADATTLKVEKISKDLYPEVVNATQSFYVSIVNPNNIDEEVVKVTNINLVDNNTYDIWTVERAQQETTAIILEAFSTAKFKVDSVHDTRAYAIAYMREWASGKQDLGPFSTVARTEDNLTYLDVLRGQHGIVSAIKRPTNADSHITHAILYRSAVTSEGTASWREVIRFPITPGGILPQNVTYESDGYKVIDRLTDEELGDTPTNQDWTCPQNLRGIITLKNGCFAGFVKNTVYLSVPYQGHAWPEEYAIPLDYEVVGLGTFGNVLVICTTSNTYLCTVTDPSNVILVPFQEPVACVSSRSIVSMQESVVFATDFGIVKITQNGITRLTNETIHEEAWRKYNPSTIKACVWHGQYLAFFDSDKVQYNGFVIDFQDLGTGLFGLSQKISSIRRDDYTSDVYLQYVHPVLDLPCIYKFASSNSLKRIYRWVSKKFLNSQGIFTLSAGKINFYDDSYSIENIEFEHLDGDHPFNGPVVNLYSINGDADTYLYNRIKYASKWCKFVVWLDDREYFVWYPRNNEPFRIPAGKRGDSCFIEIISTEPLARVQVAASIGELE